MMPFACSISCIRTPHNKIDYSDQNKKNKKLDSLLSKNNLKAGKEANKERVSSFIICQQKGSMTIEAALVLPIFLFAMFLIIMLSDALGLYMKIQGALHQNVKLAAQSAYDQRLDSAAIYSQVLADIGEDYLLRAPMEGGSGGISFDGSCVEDGDVIELVLAYRLQFPFDLIGVGTIPMKQGSTAHKWIGYGGFFPAGENAGEEEYVYITPYGTVYHRSRECSHLKLSIREVTAKQIKDLRNTNGGKYKGCELCNGTLSSEHLYVTEDGDRYHGSLTCSGLKRDIMAIPISEVGSRRPCSRCRAAGH